MVWCAQGDDYILYCHPPEQKVPKTDRLRDWYIRMLEKAEARGVVDTVDFLAETYFPKSQPPCQLTDLPQYEADYWPAEAERYAAEEVSVSSQQLGGRDASSRIPGGGMVVFSRCTLRTAVPSGDSMIVLWCMFVVCCRRRTVVRAPPTWMLCTWCEIGWLTCCTACRRTSSLFGSDRSVTSAASTSPSWSNVALCSTPLA